MENNFEYVQETQEKKGSVITGFIGALLGAAIGAVAWAAVGMMGYIASIIGFVIAFLADNQNMVQINVYGTKVPASQANKCIDHSIIVNYDPT